MKHIITEDITREHVNWIIENLEEMFECEDENENEVYK